MLIVAVHKDAAHGRADNTRQPGPQFGVVTSVTKESLDAETDCDEHP